MRLYKAVKKVCEEEHLDAITLACFAILQDLGITGCLTLSLLNDEGIPAGCAGDLQSIMSLLMFRELIGQPGFMANPTYVNSRQNEILLSHCCISFTMITYLTTQTGSAQEGRNCPASEKARIYIFIPVNTQYNAHQRIRQ